MNKQNQQLPQEIALIMAEVRDIWFAAFSEIRTRLMHLDGTTSRELGRHVLDIINDAKGGTSEQDWPTIATAKYIYRDTMLWHELADSRKP